MQTLVFLRLLLRLSILLGLLAGLEAAQSNPTYDPELCRQIHQPGTKPAMEAAFLKMAPPSFQPMPRSDLSSRDLVRDVPQTLSWLGQHGVTERFEVSEILLGVRGACADVCDVSGSYLPWECGQSEKKAPGLEHYVQELLNTKDHIRVDNVDFATGLPVLFSDGETQISLKQVLKYVSRETCCRTTPSYRDGTTSSHASSSSNTWSSSSSSASTPSLATSSTKVSSGSTSVDTTTRMDGGSLATTIINVVNKTKVLMDEINKRLDEKAAEEDGDGEGGDLGTVLGSSAAAVVFVGAVSGGIVAYRKLMSRKRRQDEAENGLPMVVVGQAAGQAPQAGKNAGVAVGPVGGAPTVSAPKKAAAAAAESRAAHAAQVAEASGAEKGAKRKRTKEENDAITAKRLQTREKNKRIAAEALAAQIAEESREAEAAGQRLLERDEVRPGEPNFKSF